MTAAAAVVAFFCVCLTAFLVNSNLGPLPLPAGSDPRVRAICTVLTDRFYCSPTAVVMMMRTVMMMDKCD